MNKQELKALRARIAKSHWKKQGIAERLSLTPTELSHILHGRRKGTEYIFNTIEKLIK